MDYWIPVDQYIAGVKHAILHLLLSLYFTRAPHDMGLTKFKEPFTRLLTQGMVCKETVKCPEHGYLFPDDVAIDGEARSCKLCGKPVVVGRVEKMSKSKRNVIDPNTLLERYGADTTRLFCLFAAPPEKDLEWSEQGVEGGYRFLNRVWRLSLDWITAIQSVSAFTKEPEELQDETVRALYKKTHQTIRKVGNDIEDRFHFNTAISAVMELVNAMYCVTEKTPEAASVIKFALESATLLLSPMVPHFSEELWQVLGHSDSILLATWPSYKESALTQDEMLIVFQVNGKIRSKVYVAPDTDDDMIKKLALDDENMKKFIGDKTIRKVVLVKGKLVNVVV